ncbi:hypothetical protein GX48_06648 [Paracoccidioides brasiliensis]|nr:hypothetical protein GX48_06648 [Paracoccidioides brasiliensis]
MAHASDTSIQHLSDIEGYEYPSPIECLNINMAKIKEAVHRASPNKAPGADGITNGRHPAPGALYAPPQPLQALHIMMREATF